MSNSIVQFWKNLGQELTPEELEAYTDNGPVRQILLEMLSNIPENHRLKITSCLEVGGMLKPISLEMVHLPFNISQIHLIDPIYSVHGPNMVGGIKVNIFPSPLNQVDFEDLDFSTVILENVLNYLDAETVEKLLSLPSVHYIIIGNRTSASFGDKHPKRIGDVCSISSVLEKNGFKPVIPPFVSDDSLIGIYVKSDSLIM